MEEKYLIMIKEERKDLLTSIIDINVPIISNLSNLSKVIYDTFQGTCWAGFYLCDPKNEIMYLGPFQGPVACTSIKYQNGVCGACATTKKSIIVPDVHKFPGHIACYSLSNSEIVVPIIKDNIVLGIIDLDSTNYNNYNQNDCELLEYLADILKDLF